MSRTHWILALCFALCVSAYSAAADQAAQHSKPAPGADSASIALTGKVAIYIDDAEPGALQKAAEDLRSDASKIFGVPVQLIHTPAQAAPITIWIGLERPLPGGAQRPEGREIYREVMLAHPAGAAPQVNSVVVLTGSDLRGAIYAVYDFSQRFFGVDPFWYWNDNPPKKQARILVPKDLNYTSPQATFYYRGWFLNDEDLLTGWKPGTADHTGISLGVWDKVFEALLRLKGNMVVPGTFLFPDEPQVRAASERGLIISHHHIEVLGTNTYRWPEDKPYSFARNPDLLINAWTNSAKTYLPQQEVIWTVGYRGRHDRPFWVDDHSVGNSDADHAKAIDDAIQEQIRVVSSIRKNPEFIMNAWMEAVPLILNGNLKIPGNVTLVWPDDGFGLIRDEGHIGAGQGVYYHTAMENGRANQLSEGVPMERIQREIGRAVSAGATRYLLINTSDVRPVTMSTRAVMEMAWDAQPWVTGGEQQRTSYLKKWSAEEFGKRTASAMPAYYQAYYAAPARYGKLEDDTMEDNFYHTLSRELLARMIHQLPGVVDTGAPLSASNFSHWFETEDLHKYASRLVEITAEASPRWQAARTKAEQARAFADPERHLYFQYQVLTQLDINQYSNDMLLNIARAANQEDTKARAESLRVALADLDRIQNSMHSSEYGQWAGFYRGELMVNVRLTREMTVYLMQHLNGEKVSGTIPGIGVPDPYVLIKAYQTTRRVPVEPQQ